MPAKRNHIVFLAILLGSISALTILLASVKAQSTYPETVSVLQALYNDETEAVHNYIAYARKADSENYPNIAKLFVALSSSESIHARNFKNLLTALNVQVKEAPRPEVHVSSTKKNLKRATEIELQEIDRKYPQFIEMIKPENHQAAIRYITYAWESEKQHQDLIKRIQSGTGIFFGLLTRKIEDEPADYFVCQNCGSTLTELPENTCPICGGSATSYKKMEMNI